MGASGVLVQGHAAGGCGGTLQELLNVANRFRLEENIAASAANFCGDVVNYEQCPW